MDKIILRGLPVDCVIGTLPSERDSPQRLCFDLTLSGDFSRAGATDDLNDAVDYTAVERAVREYAAGTKFQLLERLAYACADRLLESFPLLSVVVPPSNLPVLRPRKSLRRLFGRRRFAFPGFEMVRVSGCRA